MLLLTALSQGSSLADLQPLWALYCLQSHGLGPKSDDQWQEYSWRPVISGECQGSLLGPILLNTFSNGLDDGAECTLSKAADYTKLGEADVPESGAAIQRDYSWLEKWADRNLMKYNKEKCLVWHCLEKRLQASLCASWGGSLAEKDLRTLMDTTLNITQTMPLQQKQWCYRLPFQHYPFLH